MPRFFDQTPEPGKPLAMRGLAKGLRRLEEALDRLEVLGVGGIDARIEWDGWTPAIIISGEPIEGSMQSELHDYPDGATIKSTAGQLVIGQRRWSIGALSVSGSSVPEDAERWAYVEINLDTGDAALKLTADAHKPTDAQTSSGYLYCITLSKWKRTGDGWDRVCRARPDLHIHGILAE